MKLFPFCLLFTFPLFFPLQFFFFAFLFPCIFSSFFFTFYFFLLFKIYKKTTADLACHNIVHNKRLAPYLDSRTLSLLLPTLCTPNSPSHLSIFLHPSLQQFLCCDPAAAPLLLTAPTSHLRREKNPKLQTLLNCSYTPSPLFSAELPALLS